MAESSSIGRSCPDCGESLSRNARRCACGWERMKPQDMTSKTCCHIDHHGVVCGKAGTFSPGTHGGGPWYCRAHDPFGSVEITSKPRSLGAIQTVAARWCAENGLRTTDQMRAYCSLISQRRPLPDQEWADLLRVKMMDGVKLPWLIEQAAKSVANEQEAAEGRGVEINGI